MVKRGTKDSVSDTFCGFTRVTSSLDVCMIFVFRGQNQIGLTAAFDATYTFTAVASSATAMILTPDGKDVLREFAQKLPERAFTTSKPFSSLTLLGNDAFAASYLPNTGCFSRTLKDCLAPCTQTKCPLKWEKVAPTKSSFNPISL